MKKGGRLIVAGIFTNGFFYVVASEDVFIYFVFHPLNWRRKKKSQTGRLFTKVTFSLTFFIFSVCLLVAAESYELSYQCAGGKQAQIY